MKTIRIFSPDGQTRSVALDAARISIGRSIATTISFPEDGELSRQHLALDRDGDSWYLCDLGSKNGTQLNGARITERVLLKSGDRIRAGSQVIVYDGSAAEAPKPVVVFDARGDSGDHSLSSKVVTHFDGVVRSDGGIGDAQLLAASHVSALIRAGNELAGNRPLPELFRFILDLAIEAVKADRGILMTTENDDLVVRANKGDRFRISTAVRDRVLNSGHSVLVRDTSVDDAFRERRSILEQNVRTLMAVPLQTRDTIIGIIYVDSPSLLREFSRDDLNLLTVMANVAAIRIEHTRYAEIERTRQLLARELEQAAEIQTGFLPSAAPVIRGLDVAGYNAPCRTVGGDYYDFFPYGKSRIAMVLGDVSGKGMPASLLMMGLQARVQVLIEEPKSLAEVMTRLNRITSANCPANRFITLFLCILDGETGKLTFCNAGHNPPLIVRANGSYEQLEGSGSVLGLLPETLYQEYRAKLSKGDALIIYSDGVTEAPNPSGHAFGMEGIAKAVTPHLSLSADAIIARINAVLAAYTNGAPPSDDITLIAARRVAL